jgi:hypothetical protein
MEQKLGELLVERRPLGVDGRLVVTPGSSICTVQPAL